jgi:hypothetical protein
VLDEKGAQALVDGSPYGDDTAIEMRAVDAVVPPKRSWPRAWARA